MQELEMKGYMGQLLRVNLTKRSTKVEPLREDYTRDYIGGSELGVRLAYDEIPPETQPLSPQNKLFFMTGPVTATSLGTAGRFQVIFKSPLTGILCDSSSGGHWGAALRTAGYDGLIIEGAAASPVYLYINAKPCEIRDASQHWGKDTFGVQDDIRQEIGDPKARLAVIGPAGELGVLYAAIMNDEARAAARGGDGTVMGSKKLKAIAIRGNLEVDLADPDGFKTVTLDINKENATSSEIADLRKFGTTDVLDSRWAISDIPVKNWSIGSSEEICIPIGGRKVYELMPKKHPACHRCTIGCARWTKIGTHDGAGKLLGLCTRRMAEKLGGDSFDFAVQVKGLEIPMHDARAGFSWAPNYATASRGGCHLHGMTVMYEDSDDPILEWGFTGTYARLSNNGKAGMARFAQNWAHILNSLVMCCFATVVLEPSDFCNLLNTATGRSLNPMDLLQIGDRINVLHRAYNYRCGIRRKDDTLPKRAMTPLKEGGAAGKTPDLDGLLEQYYRLRDWEADGKPSQEKLLELGLGEVVRDLYSA
jgi:aldehyde:ferredoxin oxidoreductase